MDGPTDLPSYRDARTHLKRRRDRRRETERIGRKGVGREASQRNVFGLEKTAKFMAYRSLYGEQKVEKKENFIQTKQLTI